MIENPGNDEADPDDEAYERNGIDADDAAQACVPELTYVGDEANGEKAKAEEDAAQEVGLAGACFSCRDDVREDIAGGKHEDQGGNEADDEFREAFPNFPF